jgi:hypothetical protein
MRSYAELILIGHGSEEGIFAPNGEILSWKNIGNWVNQFLNAKIYFLACNSNFVNGYINKPIRSFTGDMMLKLPDCIQRQTCFLLERMKMD